MSHKWRLPRTFPELRKNISIRFITTVSVAQSFSPFLSLRHCNIAWNVYVTKPIRADWSVTGNILQKLASRLCGLWAHVTPYLVSLYVWRCVYVRLAVASNVIYSNTDSRHVVAWVIKLSCCDSHDYRVNGGARGKAVKAQWYKPEGRGSRSDEVNEFVFQFTHHATNRKVAGSIPNEVIF
jgi:hypothetical protein